MKWGLHLLASVFCTMVAIYIIRYVANKYNIPLVKDIANV